MLIILNENHTYINQWCYHFKIKAVYNKNDSKIEKLIGSHHNKQTFTRLIHINIFRTKKAYYNKE